MLLLGILILEEAVNELALFAGAGGGILGGKLLGWRTVCAVEIDPYARRVLFARQADGCLEPFPIWDDVTTFDGHRWRGSVDVVSGGFPCQDISAAGRRAGIRGERSGLWSEMARIVGEVQPRFVWVENSAMLVVRGLDVVLGDLASLGYDARWGVVSARNAGLRHGRERLWIVADAEGFDGRDKPEDVGNGSAGRCRDELAEGSPYDWVDVATELCGMADGVACRLDRLHAIGNGQVPAVVRLAWRTLAGGREMSMPNIAVSGGGGADVH